MSIQPTQTQNGTQSTVLAQVKKWLEDRKPSFESMLPKHLSVDRFFKIALNCISRTPNLQRCSPSSLFQSIATAAELGLEPGGALGEAYLVPFKDTCQLIIGYRGFIRLARQSGELAQIEAHIVHENDKFELRYGLNPTLEHSPTLTKDPGKPLFVYCLARLKDGSSHIEAMTIAEVDKIRARSRSGNNGPWQTDYGEMAKKTVVRRAAKYLPMSSERWQKAMEADDTDFVEGEVVADVANQLEASASKGNERAKKALSAKKAGITIIEALPEESGAEALNRAKEVEPAPQQQPEAVPEEAPFTM